MAMQMRYDDIRDGIGFHVDPFEAMTDWLQYFAFTASPRCLVEPHVRDKGPTLVGDNPFEKSIGMGPSYGSPPKKFSDGLRSTGAYRIIWIL